MNQCFFILCAYLPFFTVALLNDTTGIFHKGEYSAAANYSYIDEELTTAVPVIDPAKYARDYQGEMLYEYWQAEYHRWLTGALYSGIVLFVLLLPLFRDLFVKQWALPKKT